MTSLACEILVVGDSRLRHLEPLLNDNTLNLHFTVKSLPGAKIADIALSAMASLSYSKIYDLTIIAGGINDMSRLAYSPTKHALPRYGNTTVLIDNTLDALRISIEKIRSITTYPVILATIAGMDFAKYSPEYSELLQPLQRGFNNAVLEINKRIRGINRLANLETVNLAYPVHRCKGGRGRYCSQYSLLFDGLHPSNQLLRRWVKTIYTTCANIFPDLAHRQALISHHSPGDYHYSHTHD